MPTSAEPNNGVSEPQAKDTSGNNNEQDGQEPAMRRTGGWFGWGQAEKAIAAKEEAARITQEADIRRLYEAGTQRQVLEQLYNPDQVLKCIQKIDKERELLQFLEEEQLLEAAAEDAAIEEQKRLAQEKLENEAMASKGQLEEISEHPESSGNIEVEELLVESSEISSSKVDKKFKISFGDDEDGNVTTTVQTQMIELPTGVEDEVFDRTMDVSLDEVNLSEVGLDSVSNFNLGDDKEDHNHLLPSEDQQDSEEDLLKELLITDGDESSHFDDSVTIQQDIMEAPTGAIHNSGIAHNPSVDDGSVVIDASSVMQQQSAITLGSYGSSDSAEAHRRASASYDTDATSSSHHEITLESSKRPAEGRNYIESSGPAEEANIAEPIESTESDVIKSAETTEVGSEAVGETALTKSEEAENQVKADSGESGGTDTMTDAAERKGVDAVSDETGNSSEQPEAEEVIQGAGDKQGEQDEEMTSTQEQEQPDGHGHGANETSDETELKDDVEDQGEDKGVGLVADETDFHASPDTSSPMEDTGEVALTDLEVPQGMTESDVENDDQMDASTEEEEVEVMSDDDEDAMMDERDLQMETTSVEDDEELSDESPKEVEKTDAEMNDESVPVAMDAADEPLEEVSMKEAASDDVASEVTDASEDDKAPMTTTAGGVDSDADSDSDSSEDLSPPPPPPPPPEAATGNEETVEEEIIDEYVDEPTHGRASEYSYIEEVVVVLNGDSDAVVEVLADGDDEVEEQVVDDEQDEEEIVDDGDVEEEIVDGGHHDEVEEEVINDEASAASSYADQVVESWQDVIEEEPEDLEAAVSALIAVVYKDDPDVDVESMLRRTRLSELYKYLKSQYWYKIHTNKEEAQKAAEEVEEKPREILSIDDMLKGRLQGLIKNVQQMDQSMSESARVQFQDDHRLDESTRHENKMKNLISNVQMSSRNVLHSENNALLGPGTEDDEEELLPQPHISRVDKATIHKLSAKDGNSGSGGRHHVAKYYEKAVNNRAQRVVAKWKNLNQLPVVEISEPVDTSPVHLEVKDEDGDHEQSPCSKKHGVTGEALRQDDDNNVEVNETKAEDHDSESINESDDLAPPPPLLEATEEIFEEYLEEIADVVESKRVEALIEHYSDDFEDVEIIDEGQDEEVEEEEGAVEDAKEDIVVGDDVEFVADEDEEEELVADDDVEEEVIEDEEEEEELEEEIVEENELGELP